MSTEQLLTEYLNGLMEERRHIENILELTEQTRRSLLETDAEQYERTVMQAEQEMSRLLELRRSRQQAIEPHLPASGRSRPALLELAPASIRDRLASELDAYASGLDRLRRRTVSNNLLLSDRILMLRHLVEGVHRHFEGKPGYGAGGSGSKQSAVTLMIDARA